MSLILSLGSNIGDRFSILAKAQTDICKHLNLIAASNIYESPAVDYLAQPDFLNQLLEFNTPSITPAALFKLLSSIEVNHGRKRDIPKGPRTLDIDILFWDLDSFKSQGLEIPHPRLFSRNFILFPLRELPYFETLISCFTIPDSIESEPIPIIRNSD